jgi:dCTP deaminase
MILTDREIAIALDRRQISIDPRPPREALSSTSIDLTLARAFAEWSPRPGQAIRPGTEGYVYSRFAKELQRRLDAAEYTLAPGAFVLAWTAERISIPVNSRLAARVEGKSSLARLGVGIHITAPTIHSGFEGQVQLEMFNFGPNTIILDAGMRVCQLIFEQTVGTPEKGYEGSFARQTAQKKPKPSHKPRKSR